MATSKKTTSVNTQEKINEKQIQDQIEYEQWIKESAYFIAESRGFIPGCEQEDWHHAVLVYQQSFS